MIKAAIHIILGCLPVVLFAQKDIKPPPGKAVVYIFQEDMAEDIGIMVDNTFIGTAGMRDYVFTILSPGVHILSSRTEGRSDKIYNDIVDVELLPNRTYYFQLYLNTELHSKYADEKYSELPQKWGLFFAQFSENLGKAELLKYHFSKNNVFDPTADLVPPAIIISSPQVLRGGKTIVMNNQLDIEGKITDQSGVAEITVNNVPVSIEPGGVFKTSLALTYGDNLVSIKGTDTKKNIAAYTFIANRKPGPGEGEIRIYENKVSIPGTENRIALIIGNGAYPSAPLRNASNDAELMTTELQSLGFEVTTLINGSQSEIKKAITDFGAQLEVDRNTVGLFYYAGHGLQVHGKNYLVPVDAAIEKEPDVDVYCVDLDNLLLNMEYSGNNMNIIILDACRNNPFGRNFRSAENNGLATISAPVGTLIAFATAPGSTASDGEGANGLYTQELVKAMNLPAIKIEEMFKKVRTQVKYLSNGLQIPWENSSIEGDFYFRE